MQVFQSLNDTMDIVFNPAKEGLCLLDFVLIEDKEKRFLGQVVEISNGKYDLNMNNAKIKIVYSINPFDEVVDYDGYTPSKMCNITLYNQKEMEDFINADKTSLRLDLNPKTMLPLDFNLDFFKNSPVIFADKMDDFNAFGANLSQKLTGHGNVVIFDYTGSLMVRNSIRLRATVDFKLPLDFNSLSYIWDIALANASLETQAVCEEIFNEVKNYVKTVKEGFIPFDKFLNVVSRQYDATPIVELLVLKNRLLKYQQNNIFAQKPEDFKVLSEITKREEITIIDFSPLETVWHKEFNGFALRNIKENSFVFIRLNENNSDCDLINSIQANKRLNIIPSVSYGFKRFNTIIENSKNYVFLPTLNLARNFGYVSPAIMTLNKNCAILFGHDTKELIFKLQNNPEKINRYSSLDEKESARVKLKSLKRYSLENKNTYVPEYSFDEVEDGDIQNVVQENFENAELENNTESTQETLIDEEQNDLSKILDELTQEQHFEEEIEMDNQIADEISDEDLDFFNQDIENIASEEVEENIEAEETDFVEIDYNDESLEELQEISENEQEDNILSDEIVSDMPQEDLNLNQIEVETSAEVKEENINLSDFDMELSESFDDDEENQEEDDDFSLADLASESLDDTFDDLVEQDKPKGDEKIVINDNTILDLSKIKDELDEIDDNLPIYNTDEDIYEDKGEFKQEDVVLHEKYGKGKITQIINYSDRCLLQIEFEEIGKRLLDPKIAKLKKAQD